MQIALIGLGRMGSIVSCVIGIKRIAADLSKQRPTVVAIVTPAPIKAPRNTE